MIASYENLLPEDGQSFRCFNRSVLRSPLKWHRHPEIELTYVPTGAGSRLVGDHIGSYKKHDLVLLGSNLPHTWMSDDYRGKAYDLHEAIVLQFREEFLGTSFFGVAELASIGGLLSRSKRGLWFPPDIAMSIAENMTAIMHYRGAVRIIELLTILHKLASCTTAKPIATELFQSPNDKTIESRIQQVCDYICARLTDPELGLTELAELADMNASAFSRFFKQSTGRTLSEYINELRIGFACRLLSESDDSILSISNQSGYENLSNFNRRFRELRKTTPREYRALFRSVS